MWMIATALTVVYIVWGSTYLAIHVAVQTLPPFMMASARFIAAGMILAAILVCMGRFRMTRHQVFDSMLIGALLLLGGNGMVSWAQQEIPSGVTTLIISLTPLFVALGDWAVWHLFRDGKRGAKPNALTFVGIGLGLVGLIILVAPSIMATDATYLNGYRVLAVIFACLSWCVGSLFTRYARDAADPFTGAAVQMFFGGLWLLILSCITCEPLRFNFSLVSQESVLAWIYLVIMGSLVTFTIFIWLMKHASPSLVATYSYVNPIVAVFLGWLFLDEPISPRILLTGGVIVIGVAIITLAARTSTNESGSQFDEKR